MTVLSQAGVEVRPVAPPDEFDQLVKDFRLRGFHFALQLVGNREDAMDITQEAFLRVHRNWRRRDPNRPFAPWFYAIVRNLAIDSLRKRASLREDDSESLPDVSPRHGPDILAEKNETKRQVWLAINQLPDDQRETLILRDLHGFAYKEIAEILRVPVSTVNSRLHDARETLRRKLQRCL